MSVPTKMTNFYRFPNLDARIAIDLDGDALVIAFLAKGNAYKGKGADRKLYKRNPDRTQAIDRLLPLLDSVAEFVAVRVGKTSNESDYVDTLSEARKAYSAGGNYRFDLAMLTRPTCEIDLDALGLVRCENRPVPFAFV